MKKLYPLTLTREADDILVGGFTLKELSEKTGIVYGSERKNIVPTQENLKKAKKGEKVDLITYPHEIVLWNKKILSKNLELKKEGLKEIIKGVFVGKNVKISKNVEFDTKEGIILIEDGVKIGPFSYIEGPVFIGKNTKIKEHSSIKDFTCIGHTCKVGGEVECSVIFPYANKQHYGFLGNSVVGSWVNIGAGTTNSDLKNTYGTISVKDGLGKDIDTGEQFLGCVIGDYTKTAIGTMIFTGKIIGVNSILYGNVTKDVPSFVNFTKNIGKPNEEFRLDKAIEIQEKIFGRRDVVQTQDDIKRLKDAYSETEGARTNFLENKP
jgi:glucose-1-phosphate thymidylyltransferase